MFQKIIAYLEKLGYTVEEQGRLEKYLIVFKEGKPLGFILSDLSVKLVSDAEGCEHISEILDFIRKNQDLQSVGSSEFLIGEYRGNQITTFYDEKTMLVRFATYIHDCDTGEVHNAVYDSEEAADYHFITQTKILDIRKFMPVKRSLKERIRLRLIRFLQEGQQ